MLSATGNKACGTLLRSTFHCPSVSLSSCRMHLPLRAYGTGMDKLEEEEGRNNKLKDHYHACLCVPKTLAFMPRSVPRASAGYLPWTPHARGHTAALHAHSRMTHASLRVPSLPPLPPRPTGAPAFPPDCTGTAAQKISALPQRGAARTARCFTYSLPLPAFPV